MLPSSRFMSPTGVDPWFLHQIAEISGERIRLQRRALTDPATSDTDSSEPDSSDTDSATLAASANSRDWLRAKRLGFSDSQLAYLWNAHLDDVRAARVAAGVLPTYKTVDTCAAEFEASTPYHYSTYEDTDELRSDDRPKVVICGSGPNRIGQGIEFDYCCVHASEALREAGYSTLMVNCNPETVSTDYDTSDQLFFEPLTTEGRAQRDRSDRPDGSDRLPGRADSPRFG